MTERVGFTMNNVIVDEETGEHFERLVLRDRSSTAVIQLENNNVETGEPEEVTQEYQSPNRVPFQIPRALLSKNETGETDIDYEPCKKPSRILRLPRNSEPFGETNAVMLFLPVVFYFRWVAAVLMSLEAFLHVWAHHKNKRLQYTDVYFRSPFHSISSEFCAICQSETSMNRIGKMQAIRSNKILRQCNYMKRVVT